MLLNGGQPNFALFGRLLGCYTIYIHFRGLLPPHGILPHAKFALRQILHSPILTVLLHGTPAAGLSQTLRRGRRNGIMELSHRALPIFGWAAVMLGIGPHSSFNIEPHLNTETF